jgi:hypothetical protein
MTDKISWHRYVRIEAIPAFLALGWEWDQDATPLHAPHGFYSVLMEWKGSGEPREPIKDTDRVDPLPDEIENGAGLWSA